MAHVSLVITYHCSTELLGLWEIELLAKFRVMFPGVVGASGLRLSYCIYIKLFNRSFRH